VLGRGLEFYTPGGGGGKLTTRQTGTCKQLDELVQS